MILRTAALAAAVLLAGLRDAAPPSGPRDHLTDRCLPAGGRVNALAWRELPVG